MVSYKNYKNVCLCVFIFLIVKINFIVSKIFNIYIVIQFLLHEFKDKTSKQADHTITEERIPM